MSPTRLAARFLNVVLCACLLLPSFAVATAEAASEEYAVAGTFPAVTWHLKTPHGCATDAVGNVYVADTGNDRIVKYDVYGRYVTSWGGTGTEDGKFNQPWDVACDPSGTKVFVVDTMNHRIQQFWVNGKSYGFVRKWGTRGGQDFTGYNKGEFEQPKGIALDSQGNVFIADTGNERIQKYQVTDTGIKNVATWGSAGSGESLFYEPYALDVSNTGWVYVLDHDQTNCYVSVFRASDGKPVSFANGGNRWGAYYFTKRPNFFNHPEGIAVDDDGMVYVGDSGGPVSTWIQKFTAEGEFVLGWGMYAEGDTYNNTPAFKSTGGLDASGSGDKVRLIASDYLNDRFREFNGDGVPMPKRDFLGVLGSHGVAWWRFKEPWDVASGEGGSVYVADRYNHRLERYNSEGVLDIVTPTEIPPQKKVANGYFVEPTAVAYDSTTGLVYATEYGDETNYKDNNRVQCFNADLQYQWKWGELGTGHGQFKHPQGIAVGPGPVNGERWVYVADTGNNRIEVFDTTGNYYKATIGSGVLLAPTGITVKPDGTLYVVDSGHKRVTRFNPTSLDWKTWTPSVSFGHTGTGDAVLSQPWGIDVDDTGNLYVSDIGAGKIKKYSSAGIFDTAIGVKGTSAGELNGPRGVSVSPDGVVYVADTVNDRFQAFVKPVDITINYPNDLGSYAGPVTPSYFVGAGAVTQGAELDGAPWNGASVSTEGVHIFRVWAEDEHGLTHEKVVQFTIDLTAPFTLGSADTGAVFPNTATILLTPMDGLSGVERTRYLLDGALQEGTLVSTSKQGLHTLEYWSIDRAGNEEPHHIMQFTVTDTIPPVTTSNVTSVYSDKAVITLKPSDAGSPITSTVYRLDGGAVVEGTSLTVTKLGSHILDYRSKDAAGNSETTKTVTFTVKKGTKLSVTRASSTVSYGGTATTRATLLLSNGTALKGKTLKLYHSSNGTTWSYVKSITSSTGSYSYSTTIGSLRYFKWVYAGDSTYRDASGTTYVDARAKLSPPGTLGYVYQNRASFVYGDLRPQHPSGSKCVTLRAYHYERRSNGTYGYVYKSSATYAVTNKDTYSHWSGTFVFPYKGKWAIRTWHNDANHAESFSSYTFLTVR